MAKEYKIEIEKRKLSENVKYLRYNGGIPGVYYSHNSKESLLFKMDMAELREAIKSGAQIFKVSVGGKLRDVIFKSVQYHPVTDVVQHIDLYGVNMDIAINIKVPLTIVGECVGVKEDGGVLSTPLTEIEISCLPGNIPKFIEVDITDLHLGDSLQAENLELDDSLELVTSLDSTIASITHAAVEVEPEAEDDELAEGEEGEEGEGDSSDGDSSESSDDSDSGDSE